MLEEQFKSAFEQMWKFIKTLSQEELINYIKKISESELIINTEDGRIDFEITSYCFVLLDTLYSERLVRNISKLEEQIIFRDYQKLSFLAYKYSDNRKNFYYIEELEKYKSERAAYLKQHNTNLRTDNLYSFKEKEKSEELVKVSC